MNIIKIKFPIFLDLKFAVFLLFTIAFCSSLGSIIPQEENPDFYLINYKNTEPIFGFLTSNFIFFFGLDHLYRTWWFFFLLFLLSFSLISCTFLRQFPLVKTSKEYFFKKNSSSYEKLPFFIVFQHSYFLKESFLKKLQTFSFSFYQTKNFLYAYKGLIGRISPIFVHISLLCILGASVVSSLDNFKSQEAIPKGESFRIQNILQIGPFTNLPSFSLRVNDFWIDYKKQKISQFYSNVSLLNNSVHEVKEQTISVNHPFSYKSIDFYQNDWNVIGLRIQPFLSKQIFNTTEYPLFSLNPKEKLWITWIPTEKQTYSLVFTQLDNTFFVYDEKGSFVSRESLYQNIENSFQVIDTIPSIGFLIKYDPVIWFLYSGFGLLIITTLVSYFPYIQLWAVNFHLKTTKKNLSSAPKNAFLMGGTTNRGILGMELEFENFLRSNEKKHSYVKNEKKN